MINPVTDPITVDEQATAALLPLYRWHADLAIDSIETDSRLWPMPGIYLRHGDEYREVYLPALEQYMTRTFDNEKPAVRLPEGARGRRASYEVELWCVTSPVAPHPCEGSPLPDGVPVPRHHGPQLGEGHAWSGSIAGRDCMRCGCRFGVRRLGVRPAPIAWVDIVSGWAPRGLGEVDCVRGDERTRQTLLAALTEYQSGGFGAQTYRTTPAMRRALLERVSAQIYAGGRWLLPDDVTPETADELEERRWVDLAALVRQTPSTQRNLPAFDQWVAGEAGPPREAMWRGGMWSEVKPVLEGLVRGDGPPIYVDARAMLGALRRSWRGEDRHGFAHPAEIAMLDLREMHDDLPRQSRCSLLVLFPPSDEALDRPSGLCSARALWSSGR